MYKRGNVVKISKEIATTKYKFRWGITPSMRKNGNRQMTVICFRGSCGGIEYYLLDDGLVYPKTLFLNTECKYLK